MKFAHVNTEVTFNKISVSLVPTQFNNLWSSGRVGILCDHIQQDKVHGCIVTVIVQAMIHGILHQ